MLEDSLMESQHRLSSPNQRWTTIASFTVQSALAAALIAVHLVHPESIPSHTTVPAITLPLKPVPPRVPHVETATAASSNSAAPSLTAPAEPRIGLRNTSILGATDADAPPSISLGSAMGDAGPGSIIIGTGGGSPGPRVRVAQAAGSGNGVLQISRGVLQGLLLAPIRPIYPPIARATRTEGTVVIEAIISKTGAIESIHATSGPQMLRNAAIDAVRNARYSPYLLNGSPTEVETTITVNFRLGD